MTGATENGEGGSSYHRPVLVEEVVGLLVVDPGGVYLDATLGGGGHAEAILKSLSPRGRVIGLDRDPEAVAHAAQRLSAFGERFAALQSRFSEMREALATRGVDSVSGVLFDLGVSSHQLDTPSRGFSFDRTGPLDFRMDPQAALTAAEVVNRWPEDKLAELFWKFGEERRSRKIARAIVAARRKRPLETTTDLADVVRAASPGPHVAKTLARVFQAIRIAVNQELEELEAGLEAALELLRPGGRLVVIAYHSLEDRLVKQFLRREEPHCVCPPEQPVCTCGRPGRLRILTKKPVVPDEQEVKQNPRARSARLRAAEKLSA